MAEISPLIEAIELARQTTKAVRTEAEAKADKNRFVTGFLVTLGALAAFATAFATVAIVWAFIFYSLIVRR
jgi:hypothetical protein